MIALITADGNFPFAVALGLMLAIAFMEGVGALLGTTISNLIDALLPDSLTGLDVDLDADVDIDGADGIGQGFAVSQLLGWLCFGQVPALVLLIIFLTAFGLAGFAVQGAARSLFGGPLPSILAALPALVVAVPCLRLGGRLIAKAIPKEETSAVSRQTFIGRVAVITLGEASDDNPAEAKLHDSYGQAHYVMVEPDISGERFQAGDEVLLVRQAGARFTVIRNTNPALSPGQG